MLFTGTLSQICAVACSQANLQYLQAKLKFYLGYFLVTYERNTSKKKKTDRSQVALNAHGWSIPYQCRAKQTAQKFSLPLWPFRQALRVESGYFFYILKCTFYDGGLPGTVENKRSS